MRSVYGVYEKSDHSRVGWEGNICIHHMMHGECET